MNNFKNNEPNPLRYINPVTNTVNLIESVTDSITGIGTKFGNMVKRHIAETINITGTGYVPVMDFAEIGDYLLSIAKYPKEIAVSGVEFDSRRRKYNITKMLPYKNISFMCKDGYTICSIHFESCVPSEGPDTQPIQAFTVSNSICKIEFIGRYRKKYKAELAKKLREKMKEQTKVISSRRIRYACATDSKGCGYDIVLQLRSFDSIVSDKIDIIKDTLHRHYNQKDMYTIFNIPYKLGILLYGEPGCGKSSIVKAIINELDIVLRCTVNINIINMSAPLDVLDQAFRSCHQKQHHRYQYSEYRMFHVVVLEEIDSLSITNEKLDNEAKTNLVLQYLDGPFSSDNVIYIATTNKYEKLDPRLIRDARFDCKVEVSKFTTEEEVEKLCKIFGEDKSILGDIELPIAPCTIQRMIFEKHKTE